MGRQGYSPSTANDSNELIALIHGLAFFTCYRSCVIAFLLCFSCLLLDIRMQSLLLLLGVGRDLNRLPRTWCIRFVFSGFFFMHDYHNAK